MALLADQPANNRCGSSFMASRAIGVYHYLSIQSAAVCKMYGAGVIRCLNFSNGCGLNDLRTGSYGRLQKFCIQRCAPERPRLPRDVPFGTGTPTFERDPADSLGAELAQAIGQDQLLKHIRRGGRNELAAHLGTREHTGLDQRDLSAAPRKQARARAPGSAATDDDNLASIVLCGGAHVFQKQIISTRAASLPRA